MSRKPREITPDGTTACTKCGKLKHLDEYYCGPEPYVQIGDDWYGRPMSWCKVCLADRRTQKADAVRIEKEKAERAKMAASSGLTLEEIDSLVD